MIDVIIPAYNAHKTIERTLYSIAYQRNSEDFSVYIINDNSAKDYSKEIDFLIEKLSNIISNSINNALHDNVTNL